MTTESEVTLPDALAWLKTHTGAYPAKIIEYIESKSITDGCKLVEEKQIVYSRDGEIFQEDGEIIDEAREYWESGEPEEGGYYSGERMDIIVSDLVSDCVVDDILERMDESLYDIVGEVAEDALSISDEKKEELRNIITNFISENCSCSCWAVDNVQYHSFKDEASAVLAEGGE